MTEARLPEVFLSDRVKRAADREDRTPLQWWRDLAKGRRAADDLVKASVAKWMRPLMASKTLKAQAEKKLKAAIAKLAKVRETLDVAKPHLGEKGYPSAQAWNKANYEWYTLSAALLSGVYPKEALSGLPVMPREVAHIPGVSRVFPVDPDFAGSTWDGMNLSAALGALAQQGELADLPDEVIRDTVMFGLAPVMVVFIGLTTLAVVMYIEHIIDALTRLVEAWGVAASKGANIGAPITAVAVAGIGVLGTIIWYVTTRT